MVVNADPDMLEVGNGGMTTEEYRAHFSIWALSKVFITLISKIATLLRKLARFISSRQIL